MSRLGHIVQLSKPLKVNVISQCPRVLGFCTKVTDEAPTPATPAEPTPEPVKAAPEPAEPTFVYNSPATPSEPATPVGPGASKSGEYPNTEYYTYNKMSYFDLESEMVKDRIEQPSAENGHF